MKVNKIAKNGRAAANKAQQKQNCSTTLATSSNEEIELSAMLHDLAVSHKAGGFGVDPSYVDKNVKIIDEPSAEDNDYLALQAIGNEPDAMEREEDLPFAHNLDTLFHKRPTIYGLGYASRENSAGDALRTHSNGESDSQEAYKHYVNAAAMGNVDAQCYLGLYHLGEWGEGQRDWRLGISFLQQAYMSGCVKAKFLLGKYYLERHKTPHLTIKGILWLAQAACQGYSKAAFELASVFLMGWLRPVNDEDRSLGLAFLEQAAKQGHAGAKVWLGMIYMKGSWVEKDTDKATELLQDVADSGFWELGKLDKHKCNALNSLWDIIQFPKAYLAHMNKGAQQ